LACGPGYFFEKGAEERNLEAGDQEVRRGGKNKELWEGK